MPEPMSGLRTVKRDWSSNSAVSSQDSNPIPWSPTPPQTSSSATSSDTPMDEKKRLADERRARRLKHIQDALRNTASSQVPPSATSSSSQNRSTSGQKRDSGVIDLTSPPPSKKRQLPDSWNAPASDSQRRPVFTTRNGPSSNVPSSSTVSQSSSSASAPQLQVIHNLSGSSGKPSKVFLSQEQTQILKLVESGLSVFYTGSAGTGKSVLLREIIKTLRRNYVKTPDAVAVTASTGMAACNIGGVTIHNFAGIGLGMGSADELARKIMKNKKASTRWARVKVLIIDEVSMVEADLFDKLSQIGGILRKNPTAPFGGIQLVVTGDFFQLPPVTKHGETKFAFEAKQWSKAIKRTFNLTKVFRQRDEELINMLNEMRFGKLSDASIAKFKSLSREVRYDDGIEPTELFPRREEVDRSNGVRMNRLQTEAHTYVATDGGTLQDPNQREKMLANFMAPQKLVIRVDTQVMLIRNLDETLVNGSTGRVIKFVDPSQKQEGEDEVTLPPASKGKEPKKDTATKSAGVSGLVWPLVEFIMPHGGRRAVMIQPETWKVELPNGEIQLSRAQLPLIPAWAMSIHKSQGQTLERVKVDLGKIFEKGQAYVALSRCTSLEGLQVLNFDPRKVKAHPKVVQWSETLERLTHD